MCLIAEELQRMQPALAPLGMNLAVLSAATTFLAEKRGLAKHGRCDKRDITV
jgi:hypothetical protein